MKKLSVKKLAIISSLLIATSFASAVQAAGCKVKVKYSNFPFSSTIVGSEQYKIPGNSTSTTLRKHMRVIKNYGSHDVSIKYWDASGNHWTTVKKGTTKKVSGDLKKTKCLNTPRKSMKLKGHGYWRSSSTPPKGKYTKVVTTKNRCKTMCLRSSACTGIEYTKIFATPKKSSCELHTDKFGHLEVNYNPKTHGEVWLKK